MANLDPQVPVAPQRLPLLTQAGIKRDGTQLDSMNWTDGQWVRFQRGRLKKMGGYRFMTRYTAGPIRSLIVDQRQSAYTLHCFSMWGVEATQFDPVTGAGGGVSTRTPSGWVVNANATWQADVNVQSGGVAANLVAAASSDLSDISSDTGIGVYYGNITTISGALVAVTSQTVPIVVSGGVVSAGPFVFVYGSNGLIWNSNPNNITDATGWIVGTGNNAFANTANPTDKKIVKGLPLRGGALSPAALFWSLDQLVRVSFNQGGGTSNWWKYDLLGSTSVLAKNGVIEYDGIYYWMGVDRFFVYNGVIAELPNQMNLNWIYDNIAHGTANYIWAMKVPRYGEIWWFYPRTGFYDPNNPECTHAVIYNVREQTWYDVQLVRGAGYEATVFPNPIMAGGTDDIQNGYYFPISGGNGLTFAASEAVTGSPSGGLGQLYRSVPGSLTVYNITHAFASGDTITGALSGATAVLGATPTPQEIDTVWFHEYGTDKVTDSGVFSIPAYATTQPISFPTGGPLAASGQTQWQGAPGTEYQTRLTRFEPDFTALGGGNRVTGPMTITVSGSGYANSQAAGDGTYIVSTPYVFSNTTPFVDLREQRRELLITFSSDTAGGFFELGRPILTIEQGDGRP